MSSASPIQIQAVAAELLPRALTLLFCEDPAQERVQRIADMLQQNRRDPQLLSTLRGAFQHNQLTGIVWARPVPGRTALLWGPHTWDRTFDATADALLAYAEAQVRDSDCVLIQAVLRQAGSPRAHWLEQHRFLTPIQLVYMAAPAAAAVGRTGTQLEFLPIEQCAPRQLAAVIEATYEDTLDAPQLNGVRDIDDVLAGYRSTGVFDPGGWLLVRHRGNDVGCLLLCDHPTLDQAELMYMGLIPAARGQGLGGQMVQYALDWTCHQGRKHLILAVDAANRPAGKMYAQAGFAELDRRWVSIKIL